MQSETTQQSETGKRPTLNMREREICYTTRTAPQEPQPTQQKIEFIDGELVRRR